MGSEMCIRDRIIRLNCHKPHCYAIRSAFSPAVSLSHETHRLLQRLNLERLTAAKTADMISHACRLSYQLYILSNRIVKPNNCYTRQPASHDFLFYSAPDKVYVLTATNRIAMRFAVRSAPPFCYRTKLTDNSKGGIVSGIAVRRFAIQRIAQTVPKAEQSVAQPP